MLTSDFDYHLPQGLIAQIPVEPRDSSRLMVIDRKTGHIQEHTIFSSLHQFVAPGDLLVLNQTRVIPARLFGRKIPTGGKIEVLLLRRVKSQIWECLVGGKGLVVGRWIQFNNGPKAEIIGNLGDARRIIRFSDPLREVLDNIGQMPLPPYIHKRLDDPERYQTVFSKELGSAAAPTAGLHFTQELFDRLKAHGVSITQLTLHVGLDTFAPVKEDRPSHHKIHTEWCQIRSDTAKKINQTKEKGGRVFAVGTTSVRALETAGSRDAMEGKWISEWSGPTDLFILPGYKYKVVDAIITNFHLPCSTLIMMISAFVGREKLLAAYEAAIQAEYRFYSFGDSMLIY